ncbi:hypothetical protein V5P93_005251 [Actinokineospora auranticolor]|uniref:Nucleotidyltransferase-like protein n=1 Tax=Actinokineospora auranticolor TaxID=155976 RepID=A0A2S6GCX9_9PSEU|nr:hypothetical protein [Actinokineospora auranticolor]PPK63107.1 hypothetical protein CLV40_13240 [Actinokineospora auranticolor]
MIDFRDHPHIRALLAIGMPARDYAIAGSWPLYARGWIDAPGDLDVVARGVAWRVAAAAGTPRPAPYDGVRHVWFAARTVEVLDGWFPSVWPDVGQVVDTADRLRGLPFANLDVVLRTKELLGRPKDHAHISIILANR